jgi:hypothetical protein
MIRSIEEGRKEDGNRSIADKIIKRMHDLEKTVQSNYGRWAWELLQNAKDSVAGSEKKVSVRIHYTLGSIIFSHNGIHFTEKDIRGLINQISSKEVEEKEVSIRTGRFGTGFLTTHLLSKKVFIKGIVETTDNKFFRFEFPLDRNGKTTTELIPKIEQAWQQFHISTEDNEIKTYDPQKFNTSFTYLLTNEDQKQIAEVGVREFVSLIPYVLTFIPEIFSVEIVDEVNANKTVFQTSPTTVTPFKIINKVQNEKRSSVRLLYASNSRVSIAARVVKKDEVFEIKTLENIPKLFCDFPLIGTEDFHFPIVVNSFYFNPQTERDGIWLKGDNDPEVAENRDLLEQALALYKQLVIRLENENCSNFFNISTNRIPAGNEKSFEKNWYINNIQIPLRAFLSVRPIVELEDGTYSKLSDIWFPLKSYTKEIKEKLWQFTFDMYPKAVCRKSHLHEWLEIVWEGMHTITVKQILDDIAETKSITGLSEYFNKDLQKSFHWLNHVCSYLMEDETNHPLFDKIAVIPNENGNFLLKSQLHIDKIKDTHLIAVLKLLGEDFDDLLIHHKVSFGRYYTKEKKDIAGKINEKLKSNKDKDQTVIQAISLLSEWFDKNPEEGKEFFSETYRRRAELFLNTIEDKESLYKVMRSKTDLSHLSKVAQAIEENPRLFENIEQAKEIYSLLKEYNLNDLQQLRSLLEDKTIVSVTQHAILPVTQEILANMGISSLEEWQEAIKDKDLASLYSHQSTPSTDMFLYVQTLISKAKKEIIAHLKTLNDYNLDEMDDTTAPTILAGIVKDGKPVSIVARPAYNGEVIIYYGSERDILDYEPSELWIDDGVKPRMISLGHLLKKAQIVKFPV